MNETPEIPILQTLAELAPFLENLPHPVHLHYWGFPDASPEEGEAWRLCRALAEQFGSIRTKKFARRAAHAYYPVLGVMGDEAGKPVDYGVRLIGLPAGYQLTSLVAAVQAVAFRGVTLEPLTRLRLQKLSTAVTLELVTSADDEQGTVVAKRIFGLAVANSHIRAFLLMSNMFPEMAIQYSAYHLPHLVINGRVHLQGVASEETILQHMAQAIKSEPKQSEKDKL